MESKIKKMYFQDCTVVLVLAGVLWMLLLYVMIAVMCIAPNYIAKIIIVLSGITAGAFASSSAIAVLAHLKKNQIQLYTEEIMSYKNSESDS